ncbi:MAG: primosomal protein N' [Clostridia bacterium]|nr:primosomal protein N' [Clostridia bacterium]
MVCEVYILDIPYPIDRTFDYICPPTLSAAVHSGSFVRVPFGRSDMLRTGVVYQVKEQTDKEQIKPVHAVLDDRLSLSEEMLGLCLFLKEYTLCTFGEAVRTVLPPNYLKEKPNIRYRRVYRLALSREEAIELLEGKRLRSEGQRQVIRYLMDIGTADETLVRALPSVSSAHIRAMLDKGWLCETCSEDVRNPYAALCREASAEPIVLSPAQQTAYEKVESLLLSGKAQGALLYGVTGSGKTKIMMCAIDRAMAEGRRVILLVPEIALTPQTVGLFCRRYGERVAVMHSSLSEGERADAYRRIRGGEVDLVIGTRSAVFAPLANLGLIVIDEEHEHTYKSENDPKYHARDVAAFRCGQTRALMLLCSATPSIESFYKAKQGVYTLIPLRERYGGYRLPKAYIVDMREELRLGNTSPISARLLEELTGTLTDGKQAILFLNRRGYNSQISCKSCGEVVTCPRCSVSLTYHTGPGDGKMLCHLCGYTDRVPRVCPSCGHDKLSFLGYGTQKAEGDLSQFLPEGRILRMDADTTGQKQAFDRMLEDFREGDADILLGTQMVTKGHDFPRVSLVGVILADTSLYISDFRAAERTFSLLTQVIGRAGRAGDGAAVIQTYSPDNEVIRLACRQDYDAFYEGEIALRRSLVYPPFCDMAQLTLTSADEGWLLRCAEELTQLMKKRLQEDYRGIPFQVYGPFEAQVYRLNDKFRLRIVVKCKLNTATRRFFHSLLCSFSSKKNISLAVDLNPLTV